MPVRTHRSAHRGYFRTVRYALINLLLILPCRAAVAQELVVYGVVTCPDIRQELQGVHVELWRDGAALDTLATDSVGRYEVIFGLGPVYLLRYASPGRAAKTIRIDTCGIPPDKAVGGFGMNVDMTLFEPWPGADLAFLEEPIGLARYVAEEDNIVWDMEHTQRFRDMIEVARTHGKDR